MSLVVPRTLLLKTTRPELQEMRSDERSRTRGDDVVIPESLLTLDVLRDLIQAAELVEDKKSLRAIKSIEAASLGDFKKPVPSLQALAPVLRRFLSQNLIDGWIYVLKEDGHSYPELVTGISYDAQHFARESQPRVIVSTLSYGLTERNRGCGMGMVPGAHTFHPAQAVNRSIDRILENSGIFRETEALKAAYLASQERFQAEVADGFAEQYRVSGMVRRFEERNYERRNVAVSGRRVIHDLPSIELGEQLAEGESVLFAEPKSDKDADDGDAPGLGAVPRAPLVRVFDLASHEHYWVHSDCMTRYVYDQSLREKLILPASHRDLLDVMTTNLGAFVEDFVEGKSAGNVILCKGAPGVGKTLTAEVYSELIKRPMLRVHSGTLGTDAASIAVALRDIFEKSKRWNSVILIDEVDVFICRRGDNIHQNAIVAEFLRTFEYFDGLVFMTTNRSDDIDPAFMRRCAAVLMYGQPEKDLLEKVWRVMGATFDAPLESALITRLVEAFPKTSPGDIKMLFRLTLRYALAEGRKPTFDDFRICAMFRAIEQAPVEA